MKKLLFLVVAIALTMLAFATVVSAEAINDEFFVLDFDAGDKPAGTKLPLWGENKECLVWYLDSENKLVSAKTSELTYGYLPQDQSKAERDYGNLPAVSQAPSLSSISIGETVLQDTSGTKKIVVANLHDVDFDYIYTDGGTIFANNDTLQCLYLPDDIERLPRKMLYYATRLTKFDMGESVRVVWQEPFQGCSSIESVIFSNTCMCVFERSFVNCTSLKEVRLGSSMKYVQAYLLDRTGDQMIDLYIPATIVSFGAPYNNYVTIFFTGSYEQLSNRSVFPDYKVINYNMIPYSEFDGTRTTVALQWYCYYDVSPCVAYDKGVHDFEASYSYPNGLDKAGEMCNTCTKAGCNVTEKTEIKPVFEAIGYSVRNDGTAIIGGYKINIDALGTYNAYIQGEGKSALSYGILVSNKNGVVIEDNALVSEKGIQAPIYDDELQYSIVNYRLSGFTATKSVVDSEFIISLYTVDDGEISFIQGETATNEQEISCNGSGVSLNTISLRTLLEKQIAFLNAELEGTSDEERKTAIREELDHLTAFIIAK